MVPRRELMRNGVFGMTPKPRPPSNGADKEDWPAVLSYWRTIAAEAFDDGRRAQVAECISRISSTSPEWQAAINGDAAVAAGLVLRLEPPPRISGGVDLVMTILLNTAFGDAGAALVLAHGLRKMPLDPRLRARLATSWLVHNVWLKHRNRRSGASNRGDQ